VNAAWSHWTATFSRFDENWNHTFKVARPEDRQENFAFVHKKTLFIGLNLVGGRVHNTSEWRSRLKEQVEWTKQLVSNHTGISADHETVRSVVIFGHANPAVSHTDFFGPLRVFIQNELKNRVPVLYLNGDGHEWKVDQNFFEQNNWLRIQLTGGTSEPPLQMKVNASFPSDTTQATFFYNRRLTTSGADIVV
jgi:hypothetical protein